MKTEVDKYLKDGCMRCELGGTRMCKVNNWRDELILLREIVNECGLTEEVKWGVPCYTINSKNVLLVSAFKDCCAISFFKGALIKDLKSILVKPGPNSQASRMIRFINLEEITASKGDLKDLINAAIDVERTGLKVEYKKNPEPLPEELQKRLDHDPIFKSAFEALTTGRQRGYIIHFSQPKQSKTREDRIDKCTGKILNGEGLNDKY